MTWTLAAIAAALVGLSLGMLGSGGSILTVPILRTLLDLPMGVAVSTSFPVVGGVALAAAVGHARAGAVRLAEAAPFVVASAPSAYLARRLLAPLVPPLVQTLAFAALMLVAAWRLARGVDPEHAGRARHPVLVVLAGAGVGALTGLLGVGGGFVVVPALVLCLRFHMHAAVGTSLVAIALNCAASLVADRDAGGAVRWDVVAVVLPVGVLGALAGGRWGRRLPVRTLRRTFAAVVVAAAAVMVATAGRG